MDKKYRKECFEITKFAFLVYGIMMLVGFIGNIIAGEEIFHLAKLQYIKESIILSTFGIIMTTIKYLDRR